jgi:tetratricopeptide (TPR) repeat protein
LWSHQVRLPHADPSKFTVLVAELDHDEGNSARDAIVIALENTAGIVVDRLDTAIPAGRTSEVEAGHECARKYLKDSGAKLLIWGTRLVVDGREIINLYLTPLQTADMPDTAKLYDLDPQPDLVIDPSFLGDLVQAVQLAVVNYVTTGHDTEQCSNSAQQLSTLIDDVHDRVDGDKANSWPPTTRISVRLSLAVALRTLGTITGSPEPFSEAVSVCRAAIAEARPNSEAWATAQVQLGTSQGYLVSWGTPAEKVRNLKEELKSFQAALGVFRTGVKHAAVQLMMGVPLIMSGIFAKPVNQQTILEALTTTRDALRTLDRQREPLWWGAAHALLGIELLASAAGPGDHRIVLAEAQSALKESLELTREQAPLTWAATQTMIGLASIALSDSDSENGAGHLRDSVEAFNQALTVETRSCTPLQWAEAQHSLGGALVGLGRSENNVEDLRKAEDAYHAELDVYTNRGFPSEWALAQSGLSEALRLRGDREHNPKLVCQALYRALFCAGTNEYNTRPGTPGCVQGVAAAYNTLVSDFDKHDRGECRVRLEKQLSLAGGWKNLLSDLSKSKPPPSDPSKLCSCSPSSK